VLLGSFVMGENQQPFLMKRWRVSREISEKVINLYQESEGQFFQSSQRMVRMVALLKHLEPIQAKNSSTAIASKKQHCDSKLFYRACPVESCFIQRGY